jgi:4-amino-4-deoxy-L-arabinose transferase-like glycosyltransferase
MIKAQNFILKYFKYGLLLAIAFFPIFWHLGRLPIRIWDESRLAMNAYEMYLNGDFLVTYFNGIPDMWNTKPPMLIWLQAGFMKLIGVNELAVRLPSAIAAFLTCGLLLIFSERYLKSFWFGFIAVVVLVTAQGYISVHASRTGDYDALLALFTTLSGLCFFAYIEKKKIKHLYLFFLFTACAVLTKSVTGLLFLPAILIYSIVQKQLISLLRNKHFYLGLFGFLFLVVGYYLLRESQNPGYLNAVWENELGGRFLEIIEKHEHGFWFYFQNFMDFKFSVWYFLVPFGLIFGLLSKNEKINKITLFSGVLVLIFFLIISSAKTKLGWYDVPLYPFLAVIVAVCVYSVFIWIGNFKLIQGRPILKVIPFVFLILICAHPLKRILQKTFNPQENSWEKEFYEMGYFLKKALNVGGAELEGKSLLYEGYKAPNLFYVKALNERGVQFEFKDWKELEKGDIVIACQENIKQYIQEHYFFEFVEVKKKVVTLKIQERKLY